MGNYISTRAVKRRAARAKARSNAIDKQIAEDGKIHRRKHKILILGSKESGKSTFIRQMKIMHQNGFSDAELAGFRPTVYQNLLDSMQSVIVYMRKTGLECTDHKNYSLTGRVLDYSLEPSENSYFPPEIADAIHQLWKDPTILEVVKEHSSDFYLIDSAGYFFEEALRIGAPDYLPNESDVLRAYYKSQGSAEIRFTAGSLLIHISDVGNHRSERRKWIHCFEGVTCIIFCTALSEYDQVLQEELEPSRNRLVESLVLFEAVANSRWFAQTSIVLFLNKIDIFKKKLQTVPLERCFPEYSGGTDLNKAAQYILGRFVQTNRARLKLYPHIMQATDTSKTRLVFAEVKERILQSALMGAGSL